MLNKEMPDGVSAVHHFSSKYDACSVDQDLIQTIVRKLDEVVDGGVGLAAWRLVTSLPVLGGCDSIVHEAEVVGVQWSSRYRKVSDRRA